MVEKLVVGSWDFNQWPDRGAWDHVHEPPPFAHCNRLKELTIKKVNLKDMHMVAIPLPATVKHVRMEEWGRSKLHIAEDTELAS